MKGKGLTLVAAAAVFAVAFGGAFAVSGLAPSLSAVLARASTFRGFHFVFGHVTLGAMTTTTGPTFQRVTKKLSPEDMAKAEREQAISSAKVSVRLSNLDVPDSTVEAAFDDSPDAPGYANYAARDQVLFYTDQDRDNNEPRDMKVGCFAVRGSDGKSTRHWVIKHNDMQMGDNTAVELWLWVLSGCAQSIQGGATILSPAQVNVTVLDLLPKTADYEARRRQLQANLTRRPDNANDLVTVY